MYFFLFVLLLRDLQDVLYIILLETSKEDYYPLNNNRLLFIKRTYNCGLSRLVLRKENKLRLHEKSFVVPNRIWMLNRSVSSALPCFFGSSELISFIRTMPCQIIILLQLNLKLLLMLYKRMTLKVFFFYSSVNFVWYFKSLRALHGDPTAFGTKCSFQHLLAAVLKLLKKIHML